MKHFTMNTVSTVPKAITIRALKFSNRTLHVVLLEITDAFKLTAQSALNSFKEFLAVWVR